MRLQGRLAWLLAPLILAHSVFYGLVLEICPADGAQIRIESHCEFEPCDPGKHVFEDEHGSSVREFDLSTLDEFPPIAGWSDLSLSAALWAGLACLPQGLPPYAPPDLSDPLDVRVSPGFPPSSPPLLPRLASVVIRV